MSAAIWLAVLSILPYALVPSDGKYEGIYEALMRESGRVVNAAR